MRLLEPMGERDVGELVGMVDSGCLAHGEGKREDVPRRLPGKEFDRLGFELPAIIFIDLVEKDIVVEKHSAAFMPFLKIGKAHVGTPVTNAQLICRLLLLKKKIQQKTKSKKL